LKIVLLIQGLILTPTPHQETFGHVWSQFGLSQLGDMLLLASNG
jgi:hypothetical protein